MRMDRKTDRQPDRHSHRNTLHPFRGGRSEVIISLLKYKLPNFIIANTVYLVDFVDVDGKAVLLEGFDEHGGVVLLGASTAAASSEEEKEEEE